jgi:uncharacterized integral membrane protein
MSRFKLLLFLAVCVLLVIFAMENWKYPNPPITFLGLAFLPLPHPLIIYTCLAMGFVAGYLACALKIKRERREAQAASQAQESPPEKPAEG